MRLDGVRWMKGGKHGGGDDVFDDGIDEGLESKAGDDHDDGDGGVVCLKE